MRGFLVKTISKTLQRLIENNMLLRSNHVRPRKNVQNPLFAYTVTVLMYRIRYSNSLHPKTTIRMKIVRYYRTILTIYLPINILQFIIFTTLISYYMHVFACILFRDTFTFISGLRKFCLVLKVEPKADRLTVFAT